MQAFATFELRGVSLRLNFTPVVNCIQYGKKRHFGSNHIKKKKKKKKKKRKRTQEGSIFTNTNPTKKRKRVNMKERIKKQKQKKNDQRFKEQIRRRIIEDEHIEKERGGSFFLMASRIYFLIFLRNSILSHNYVRPSQVKRR